MIDQTTYQSNTMNTPPSSPPGSPREPGAPIKNLDNNRVQIDFSNVRRIDLSELSRIKISKITAPGHYHLLGPDGERYWVHGNANTGWYIRTDDTHIHHVRCHPNPDGIGVLYRVSDQTTHSSYLVHGPNDTYLPGDAP